MEREKANFPIATAHLRTRCWASPPAVTTRGAAGRHQLVNWRTPPSASGSRRSIWAADITYVPTLAGFFFLAVVLDVASRRVIGWAMGSRATDQLVLSALEMAIWNRKADSGVIHHSDHGSPGVLDRPSHSARASASRSVRDVGPQSPPAAGHGRRARLPTEHGRTGVRHPVDGK